MRATTAFPALLLVASICGARAEPAIPDALVAAGEHAVLTLHAEGAQIYECKAGDGGKLAWAFREPIATLIQDGKTVGRHYAGPRWEHEDGSMVTGHVVGTAVGASDNDIAWLKLNAVAHKGTGALGAVMTIQRLNTKGGQLSGDCDTAGALKSVAYSADYVFLRKE
ncbi:DUF3455 domain-containing protein [Bradyrhizobium sp. STM 3557]|uniref:DUF3455 domain-containing protein n=1 Tax=Bradyrhizobium sp. STM 3557 TaxID=578920 RepID=UPI00388CEE0A